MKYSDNKTVIKFNTNSKVALFNTELLGQFSDGFWSNSSKKHWKWYNKATLGSNEGVKPDMDYIHSKNFLMRKSAPRQNYRAAQINTSNLDSGYACNNKELIECVGDRMMAFAAYGKAFQETPNTYFGYFLESIIPTIDDNKNFVMTISKDAFIEAYGKLYDSSDESRYTKSKHEAVKETITKLGGVDAIVDGINDVKYSIKELRSDLRGISTALKVINY